MLAPDIDLEQAACLNCLVLCTAGSKRDGSAQTCQQRRAEHQSAQHVRHTEGQIQAAPGAAGVPSGAIDTWQIPSFVMFLVQWPHTHGQVVEEGGLQTTLPNVPP